MKKKLYLLCNAHIDPVWQWEWEEGVGSCISTFRSAANLLKEYDFVFNHNEAVLYKYIEQYSPELFYDIEQLVKNKKWFIIGGWYNQPDCLLPCGESIVRQIQVGKQYFISKFGYAPKTAVNFDPFGHSRGLVQILKKCDQENYLFMRPFNSIFGSGKQQLSLPSEQFLWKGYDGSVVKASRCSRYGSYLGMSVKKINDDIIGYKDYDCVLSTWGVGNHGGGPSRIDLNNINHAVKHEWSDIDVIHSNADSFFDSINPDSVFEKSLISCMVGCYTSMLKIKQQHRQLERDLFFTEKICSIASMNGDFIYPSRLIRESIEDMLNVEFHDTLSGTIIKDAEESALQYIAHARRNLNEARANAFFSLLKGEEIALPNTYPVFVFNPTSYEDEQYVETEVCFVIPNDFDHKNMVPVINVFDENGNKLVSQQIKESSTISLQWRKRVIFKAKLKPLQISRFTIRFVIEKRKKLISEINSDIIFENSVKKVKISSKTGLIESYIVNGKEMASGSLFQIVSLKDNEDSWAMDENILGKKGLVFSLIKKPYGIFEKLKSIEVVSEGDIFLSIEAFFECEESQARILYKIYKEGDAIDVHIDLLPGNKNRVFKLLLPLAGDNFSGEEMFGYESLYSDGRECIAHDYLTLKLNDNSLIEIITPSTYGCSYKEGVVGITLLRTAAYCCHPTKFGPLIPENMFINPIDLEMKEYDFRITFSKEDELKKKSSLFIEKPYALNVFPAVSIKNNKGISIRISNPNIYLITVKKADQISGYIIRLQNNCGSNQSSFIFFGNEQIECYFTPFEVKTLQLDNKFNEINEMLI